MSSGSDRSNRKRMATDLNFHCENCPDNSALCSICLEPLVNGVDDRRTPVKLRCNHHFHLGCIGTAFNAKGFMECPNCRSVEDGQWMYANPTLVPVGLPAPTGSGWELCPFESLGPVIPLREMHAHESAGPEGSLRCPYVTYHLTIDQARDVAAAFGITNNFNFLTTLGQVHSFAPIVPLSPVPCNPRYFWDGLDRGTIKARHYPGHSYLFHSNLNSNAATSTAPSHQDSVYNADWIKPDTAAIRVWMEEHLEYIAQQVSEIPRQVTRIGRSRGGNGRSSGSRRGGGRRGGPRPRGGLR